VFELLIRMLAQVRKTPAALSPLRLRAKFAHVAGRSP
jgi:hypothetical protein